MKKRKRKKKGKIRLLIAGIIFFSLGSFTTIRLIDLKSSSKTAVQNSYASNKEQLPEETPNTDKVDKEENNNEEKQDPPSIGEPNSNPSDKDNPSEPVTEPAVPADGKYSYLQDTTKAKEVMNLLKNRVDSDKEKKIAYLTFDDGPSTTVTPLILDILKENDIKATFFVLGSTIESSEKSKDILKRIADEGHTIGNHTYSHDYNYLYPNRVVSPENFMADIEKNNEVISKVLGYDVEAKIIRFPGGHGSWKGTDAVDKLLEEKGYVYIDWNTLNGDAEGKKRSKDQLIERFKETRKYVSSDSDLVVLMHDTYGKEETAKALPEIIKILKSEGYEFSTLH